MKFKFSKVLKSTIIVSITTFISRIFGYIRDLVIASEIGTGILNDAFVAAFRITNMFRNIFAEGALNAAFVPMFTESLEKKGKNQAMLLASQAQSVLVISLFLLNVITLIFMPELIKITAPGFLKRGDVFNYAVIFGRITFPYLFFISMAAFYGCILNSIGKFFAYAATSIFLNIFIIAFVYLSDFFSTKGHAISFGVLCAGIFELLWMLGYLYKNKYIVAPIKPSLSPRVKMLFRKMLPAIIGSGVTHINTWVSMIILSFIPAGLSYIYYADRIVQLPLALIGTAIGVVLLPVLTRNFKSGNKDEAIKMQNKALEFVLFFTIPSAFAFFYLSNEVVYTLLERGEFQKIATYQTAKALSVLGIGLPAFTMIKVLQSNFFSQGDTKTPVLISVTCIGINIITALLFVDKFLHVGIAIANTLSGWCNFIILALIAYRNNNFAISGITIRRVFKYFIAASLMIVVCILIPKFLSIQSEAILFSVQVILGVLLYFVLCFVLKTGITFDIKLLLK